LLNYWYNYFNTRALAKGGDEGKLRRRQTSSTTRAAAKDGEEEDEVLFGSQKIYEKENFNGDDFLLRLKSF